MNSSYRTFSPSWPSMLLTYRGILLAIRARRLQHGQAARKVNRMSLADIQNFRRQYMICHNA